MALYLSPLVDVKEVDLTTTIPAVATSIAVAVIRESYKGPELKRTLVTNVDELIDQFGEPTVYSYKDILSAYGYLKYGNKLYCTRVMPDDATFAGCYGPAVSAATFTQYTSANGYVLDSSPGGFEDPDEFPDEVSFGTTPESGDATANLAFIAASRGSWGNNIKIALVGKDKYDEVKANAGDTGTVGLSAELYDDILDTDIDLAGNKEFMILVKVMDQGQDSYDLKEAFYVSTEERAIDDEGKNIFFENVINQESLYIRGAMRASLKEVDVNELCTIDYISFGGGFDDAGTGVTEANIQEAYELYDDSEVVDVNIFIDSDKPDGVKRVLNTICETSRKDCIAVLDVPSGLIINQKGYEATNLRDYALNTLNINSSYSTIYGNWLNVYDKWNAKYRWIPASGHMAGIMANTDNVSDPWFAPAGLNRAVITNVRKLAWNPSLGHRDILYKNGINPIVSFAGQGKVVWGQKTLLAKSSAFNRINVRRLFIVLEKAISTAAKYFLFEPNDPFTRLLMIDMIEPFLRDVKARRGIYDFLVVCDGRNNTPERIDRNELWVDIYIKPTRAAEFIVLNFIATKTGASFTELVAATTPA